MKISSYSLRKIIPITSIILGVSFVVLGILVIVPSESIGVTELVIFGASILISGPWFLLGRFGLRTIKIEEKVFHELGEEGVEELRANHQVFNWRNISKKNTQPVAGGDAAR